MEKMTKKEIKEMLQKIKEIEDKGDIIMSVGKLTDDGCLQKGVWLLSGINDCPVDFSDDNYVSITKRLTLVANSKYNVYLEEFIPQYELLKKYPLYLGVKKEQIM